MTESTVDDSFLWELKMALAEIESIHNSLVTDGRIMERVINTNPFRAFDHIKSDAENNDTCIRCGKPNDDHQASPYCQSCYQAWARFYI